MKWMGCGLQPLDFRSSIVAPERPDSGFSRRRSDDDDRVVLVSVTPAGQALKRRAHAVHDRVACSTQRPASEIEALTRAVQALRSALAT